MDETHLPLAAQNKQTHKDEKEEAHFHQVCRSYQQYATYHQTIQQGVCHRIHSLVSKSLSEGDGVENDCKRPTVASILPPELMPGHIESQKQNKEFCDGTIRNQYFLDCVLQYSDVPTSQQVVKEAQQQGYFVNWATEEQMSKIDSVLKSLARDWSVEGVAERKVVYDRILMGLDKYLHVDEGSYETQMPKRVAVPGSGLGRLAWEIHSKGYTVEGSDFSLPMLLASDFILNGCAGEVTSPSRQFSISPWIAETKNVLSFENRIRTVTVPDIDPSSIQNPYNDDDEKTPQFSMLAGEFLSLYSHFLPSNQAYQDCTAVIPDKFHAIACSFFLDTAPSLPEYLITIYHMLEDDGLLLHFGPLMYHWSGHGALLPRDLDGKYNTAGGDVLGRYHSRNEYLDARYLSSLDFTWTEVRQMIVNTGFELLEEEMNIPALYTSNPNSMMEVSYKCVFLVAKKKTTA